MALDILYQGSLISSADYVLTHQLRSRLRREYAQTLRTVDVLVLPSTPFPAPVAKEFRGEALVTGMFDLGHFTGAFNLTGTPAISVPSGFNSAGLPMGMQILGKALDEPTVLRVAYTYQQHAGWHKRRPPI